LAVERLCSKAAFTGSYFHGYFPSAPEAGASVFQGAAKPA